jgi:hypothetical protein
MATAINDPYEQTTADPAEARAEGAAAGVRGQARAAVDDLKEQARGVAGDARDRVRATANRQKDAAAEHVFGFASALRSAADDLNRREQRFSAGCFEQVAEGLERVSGAMRSRDLTEFVESVEEFARRQPVAFLGGTVVAGLALGRFMKSSAARRGPSGGDRATPGGGA